ncbi:hypothetical protein Bhyg_11109 [Pseudolycoriella hygida]|uniref:Venom protein n=1 Tax=Pseudolycoriella hygida TaxID=35572 RepID=A0A9Q0MW36_9DIPT|nr:hypothetical protein Bhyg_11109 [Pseudolycoriella hygida]
MKALVSLVIIMFAFKNLQHIQPLEVKDLDLDYFASLQEIMIRLRDHIKRVLEITFTIHERCMVHLHDSIEMLTSEQLADLNNALDQLNQSNTTDVQKRMILQLSKEIDRIEKCLEKTDQVETILHENLLVFVTNVDTILARINNLLESPFDESKIDLVFEYLHNSGIYKIKNKLLRDCELGYSEVKRCVDVVTNFLPLFYQAAIDDADEILRSKTDIVRNYIRQCKVIQQSFPETLQIGVTDAVARKYAAVITKIRQCIAEASTKAEDKYEKILDTDSKNRISVKNYFIAMKRETKKHGSFSTFYDKYVQVKKFMYSREESLKLMLEEYKNECSFLWSNLKECFGTLEIANVVNWENTHLLQ